MRSYGFQAGLIAGLLTLLMHGSVANAATITATPKASQAANYSPFSVTFNDIDGDTFLSLNEVTSFSGVTVFGTFYAILSGVPAIAGLTDGVNIFDRWLFDTSPVTSQIAVNKTPGQIWNYSTGTVSPVPIPAIFPIFAAVMGLFGFVGWRRRRRAAAVV